MAHNRFKAGSGKFTCYACNSETRDTGNHEAELGLCLTCLLKAYVENADSDYGTDSEEHKEAVANLAKHLKKRTTTGSTK